MKKSASLGILENKIRKIIREEMTYKDPKATKKLISLLENLFSVYFKSDIDRNKIKLFCTRAAEEIQNEFMLDEHPF